MISFGLLPPPTVDFDQFAFGGFFPASFTVEQMESCDKFGSIFTSPRTNTPRESLGQT